MGAYIEATTAASSATLIKDAADARYVSTGHFVFLQQGTFMALTLDLEKLQLTGQLVPVISDVVPAFNIPCVSRETAAGPFSISDSGALVYASGANLSYANRRRLAL